MTPTPIPTFNQRSGREQSTTIQKAQLDPQTSLKGSFRVQAVASLASVQAVASLASETNSVHQKLTADLEHFPEGPHSPGLLPFRDANWGKLLPGPSNYHEKKECTRMFNHFAKKTKT